MVATRISGSEEFTLPDRIRQALNLHDGDGVTVEDAGDVIVLRRTDEVIQRTAGVFAGTACVRR